MVTKIGLSEMDAMVVLGTSAVRVVAPMLCDAALDFELLPRKELVSGEEVSEWSRSYQSRSTETVLDSGHNAASLSSNQMIQFATCSPIGGRTCFVWIFARSISSFAWSWCCWFPWGTRKIAIFHRNRFDSR